MALVPLSGFHITCSSCAPATRAAQEQAMGEAFARWTPRAMFVLVPVFAVFVAFVARRTERNYPQHLYFALHVHAAWFLAIAAFVLGAASPLPYAVVFVFAVAVALYCGQYLKLALTRAYDMKLWRALAVTPLILLGYWMLLALAVLVILLPVVFRSL
jgi:hypothetical protein